MAYPSGRLRISFTALRANARVVRTEKLIADLDRYTKKWCDEVIEELIAGYQTVPESVTYKRTHDLERGWRPTNTSTGSRISYLIQNNVRDRRGKYYARIVHGGFDGEGQAWMHEEHEWPKLQDVLYDVMGGREAFREGSQRVVNKNVDNVVIR